MQSEEERKLIEQNLETVFTALKVATAKLLELAKEMTAALVAGKPIEKPKKE